MKHTGFGNILCPVDFSEYGAWALRCALDMAAPDSRITALSVLPAQPPFAAGEMLFVLPLTPTAARLEQARRDLEAFVTEHTDRLVECVVRDGDPSREIALESQRLGSDLIVMGTHGLSGLERLLLGSVTETVLRRAPCPVLTLNRQAGDACGHRVILCPVSLDPRPNHLEQAVALADSWKAELAVLHVIEADPFPANLVKEEYEVTARRARELLAKTPEGVKHASLIGHGEAAVEIVRLAAKRGADLIVMGVHNRSALDLLFLGSTTSSVIRSAHCPVLTVRSEYAQRIRVPAPNTHTEEWRIGEY